MDKHLDNYKLVLPEHLNHFGFLFGGYMLKWVDEMAWIAATMEYPGYRFVTIGMDKVEFKRSARKGTILHFYMKRIHEGRTSVRYLVDVRKAHDPDDEEAGPGETSMFSTVVTMVRVDAEGNKQPLHPDPADQQPT